MADFAETFAVGDSQSVHCFLVRAAWQLAEVGAKGVDAVLILVGWEWRSVVHEELRIAAILHSLTYCFREADIVRDAQPIVNGPCRADGSTRSVPDEALTGGIDYTGAGSWIGVDRDAPLRPTLQAKDAVGAHLYGP